METFYYICDCMLLRYNRGAESPMDLLVGFAGWAVVFLAALILRGVFHSVYEKRRKQTGANEREIPDEKDNKNLDNKDGEIAEGQISSLEENLFDVNKTDKGGNINWEYIEQTFLLTFIIVSEIINIVTVVRVVLTADSLLLPIIYLVFSLACTVFFVVLIIKSGNLKKKLCVFLIACAVIFVLSMLLAEGYHEILK